VLLNAGAAIYVADCADTLGEGIELARAAIGSGAAREKLRQLVAFSRHATGG
jgi:anthranilate phosphoribosyltransferase